MAASRNRPLLLGHRGARAVSSLRENSFDSFDRALADGCDGFEFDVRLTADGTAVVCHDPAVGGMEIARTPAESFPQLPRLEDVLSCYHDRAFLDIELKVAGAEVTTSALLKRLAPVRGFVLSSFLPQVLESLHRIDSNLSLGLICETRAQLQRWRQLPISFVIPHFRLVDRCLVEQLTAEKKKSFVWTVNSAASMRKFTELGVDGIISDRTALLARTLGKWGI